jgi:thiamine monophosphate kinase
MPPAFLQVAIPVLYVYDEGTLPESPPGFDMGLLPVISRALKENANTSKVTVVTGAPTSADELPRAFTSLGLQYASLTRASPEAGNLMVAEFVADHFDAEAVLEHLQRLVEERQRELAEGVEAHTRTRARTGEIGTAEDDERGDAA